MKFQIENKKNFDIIILNEEKFNETLQTSFYELITNAISNNTSLIIDFSDVQSIETNAIEILIKAHEEMYNANLSFVICCLNDLLKNEIIQHPETDCLNATPKQIEAIDIVAMEGLEREFLNGDDF